MQGDQEMCERSPAEIRSLTNVLRSPSFNPRCSILNPGLGGSPLADEGKVQEEAGNKDEDEEVAVTEAAAEAASEEGDDAKEAEDDDDAEADAGDDDDDEEQENEMEDAAACISSLSVSRMGSETRVSRTTAAELHGNADEGGDTIADEGWAAARISLRMACMVRLFSHH